MMNHSLWINLNVFASFNLLTCLKYMSKVKSMNFSERSPMDRMNMVTPTVTGIPPGHETGCQDIKQVCLFVCVYVCIVCLLVSLFLCFFVGLFAKPPKHKTDCEDIKEVRN